MSSEDLSDGYLIHSQDRSKANDTREVEEWLRNFETGGRVQLHAVPGAEPIEGRQLPTKPVRQQSSDSLGRPDSEETSIAGTVLRNIAEVPTQTVAGIDDAGRHALSVLDPLANWLNDNVADLRYEPVKGAKTTTGALTRGVSEFLTGFVPALKALRGVGVTGNVMPSMLAGMFADFAVRDPHAGRLADIWKENNLPINVLTEYLSSKPDDTEAEARFKNTLEGAFLGTATEGILLGARALRAARNVNVVKQTEEAYLRAKYGEVTDDDLKAVGFSKRPLVESASSKVAKVEGDVTTMEPRALIRGRKGEILPEDFQVYINFSKIDEPDQVKFAIGKMAEKMKGHIDEARRGEISHAETKAMADDLGMTVEDLLARRKGQGFNAEEALAARRLWAASGEQLVSLAKKAAGPNAGPLDMFAFRRQMAVHAAIQSEVIGARTETARALNAWKIPAEGGNIEKARAIEQIMAAHGTPEMQKELAQKLAILAEHGNPAAVAKMAMRGWGATSADAFKEVFVNGLLSSPKTHVVNVTSNTLVAFQQIYERQAAELIRGVTGGEGVVAGEAAAMTYGLIESFKDAFRLAAKSVKTGETGYALQKIDLPRERAISAESFRMSRETGAGRFVDFLGSAVNVPGRLLGAEDEFFKTIGYRMELRAQALRQAASEGATGRGLAVRVQEILDNPPEFIKINAADAALYNTFTNETGALGRAIMGLRNADVFGGIPQMLVLPFVRTPVNIARYAFERTPFAPLISQWRADIAAGGARADLALARMATGTAIMLVAIDLADSGLIVGQLPTNPDKGTREAMQREGVSQYSWKVGDRWFSFNRLDPLGMTMGLAADIAQVVRKGEIDQDDVDEWHEIAAMAITAVSQVTISKTYLDGLASAVEVMTDPQRYSKQYIDNLAASMLTPAPALNLAVKNVVDPTMREYGTPWEAIQARIAGMSDNLPPRRNLWGEEMTTESGLGKVYDFVSPVASKKEDVNPIDREIVRMGAGAQRIQKRSTFAGVEVNMRLWPEVYDEYTRLAGNALKHPAWQMGAKDYLNAVVSDKHGMSPVYKMMPDESRRAFISNTISNYRKLAQQQILGDPKFSGFAAEVRRLQDIAREQKMPVLGE